MKKIIGFLGTYSTYYLGCIFCFLSNKVLNYEWTYDTYSYLMMWSTQIQDWSGLSGPWKTPSISLEEHEKLINNLRQGIKREAIDYADWCRDLGEIPSEQNFDKFFEERTAIANGSIW